jgi:hypothetical protein
VSFASPPVQHASHGESTYPPHEHDSSHRHHAHSAAAVNNELHFNPTSSSYASPPQYNTHSRPVDTHQPVFPPQQYNPGSRPTDAHQPNFSSQQDAPPRPPKRPEFLIVGLFALRLAKKLIRLLDKYPEHDSDIAWINRFLHPYTRRDALAQLTGERMEDYVTVYPAIVARFIKQSRYPLAFMELNPDRKIMNRRLTEQECIDILDFADAAGEWGSTVKLPGMEAERFEKLSEKRRMAHF